jgi:cytochrome c5
MRSAAFLAAIAMFAGNFAHGAMPAEQVYKEVCSVCHATGLQKAPKFGDKAAWAPLIKEGQVTLTADGWVGEGGMPPRGGKPDLSLEEFANAVAFMARSGGARWKDPDATMLERIRAAEKKRIERLKAKTKKPAG